MNRVGQPLKLRPLSRTLILAGLIGLILFAMFQIIPSLNQPGAGTEQAIAKSDASLKASRFAQENLGYIPQSGDRWTVTYTSDSSFYGYMSRENLLDSYTERKLDERYPFDTFHVSLDSQKETWDRLTVDLNMYTGEPVGFSRVAAGQLHPTQVTEEVLTGKESDSEFANDGSVNAQKRVVLAEPWLKLWGVDISRLEQLPATDGYGLIYADNNVKVGEAPLRYAFKFSDGQVSLFHPSFWAPKWHTDYVDDQVSTATRLTLLGYGLPTLALGILALIYSILRRSHTSFKRGVFLSIVFFVIMMISTYNSLPETSSDSMEGRVTSIIMFVIYTLYSLLMASLLYFSLVGGNGLWRKEEGLNPWPRAKEAGYGKYVLDSVYAGYIWAFVLLGVQTLMFILLQYTLHNWSTTDASQSPYNMRYPWLLPVMAWLAGLSEEAVYRLFGIRMLKKIVRSTLLASLITTIIWAFGHTLYPIYPISSRPIELTVIGLLFSYIFLRYGFITAMFSHVVFDSILMGATLIFMREPVNVVAGIVTLVMPFIVGYIVYRFNPPGRERRPEPPRDEPGPEAPDSVAQPLFPS
ncbi:CPBP family intramembrane metalloprotease [Paenibacillus sp. HN-1]|uniref:CPBP family intramembrane glutamic endopeptidase n=1 Tax=Paenibacillus TaxID=44249 RepID=UPI001CA8FF5D|nr:MULTISPECIES: type II CAAX endopeptidase family protein [Paenibacillus]MBY9078759.1 CPBP family intramembrane metalloprotease [Paenibacillus sp. CGMCC 1.18879]MBY9088081.1 CPBP family intramembrane metalloprotease [Paenibacillus sinensis]